MKKIADKKLFKYLTKSLVVGFSFILFFVVASVFVKAPAQALCSTGELCTVSPDSALYDDYGLIVKGYSNPGNGYNDTDLRLFRNQVTGGASCTATGDWSGTKTNNGTDLFTVGPRTTPKLFTYNLLCGSNLQTTYGGYAIPEVRSSGDLNGIIAGFRNLSISNLTQVTAAPYSFRFTTNVSHFDIHVCGNFAGDLGYEVFVDGVLVNFAQDGTATFAKHIVFSQGDLTGASLSYTFVTEGLNLAAGSHTIEVRMGIAEHNSGGGTGAPFFAGFTRDDIMGQFAGSPNAVLQRDTAGGFLWAGPTIGSDKLKATASITITPPANKLNVQSSGVSSVSIAGSQAGSGGVTNYTVTNTSNISTTLTAPATAGGYAFSSWSGCDSLTGVRGCTAAVSGGASKTVTAVYTPIINNTLIVNSSGASGVGITSTQAGIGGATNYSRTISSNISTTLTAPSSAGALNFSSWTGCNSTNVAARTCTVSVTGGATKTVTVTYAAPVSGFSIICSIAPCTKTVSAGNPGIFDFIIRPNNFSGTVTLDYTPKPAAAGLTPSFNPSTTAPVTNPLDTSGYQLRVGTSASNQGNTYTFTIRGTSGATTCSPCAVATLIVTAPSSNAWLQVSKGDVGSLSDLLFVGISKSEYLIITSGTVSSFFSLKNWLIRPPPAYNLNVNPQITDPDLYGNLRKQYNPSSISLNSSMSNLSGGSVEHTGDYILSGTANYFSIVPAVVFINGSMDINKNINIGTASGIVFVVKNDVNIDEDVENVDGVFIVGGQFTTSGDTSSSCPNTSSTDEHLVIHGAVYVGGKACFNRNLANNTNPAETIIYEPKYLWLFREILGTTRNIFKEIAP